ncbi:MAG: tyrosine--tRNA ligase [Sulfurospirillaceae bacterium]|nr:tyrosine--tRNA ligase [Sulfurospirillaceae bacterium]
MINEALAEIKRGCAEIIDFERVESLVKEYFKSGKTFNVKAGFDPTAPDLHFGHTVLLQKMALLQKYGATVQFLIGDFTGMIGDPSGKSETRKKLDKETVLKNAQTYKEQVFKVLNPEKTTIMFNSKWLEELGTAGLVELTTTFSVARMLEREDFEKRYKSQTPISISEFIYPLLQGYDSVAMDTDIEMGGTDQKFNLLMGRQLQRVYGCNKEQAVIMVPLLEGLDGVQKMSKSLGNYIGVTENHNDMYGKILSISDELMWRYYELLSFKSLEEIRGLKKDVENGELHPKSAKEELALELTARFHNHELAKSAKEEFERVHANKDLPSKIDTFSCKGPIWIAKALVDAGLEPSTSQARRDIAQGAVKCNQKKIDDANWQIEKGVYILQVGKRKFIELKVT